MIYEVFNTDETPSGLCGGGFDRQTAPKLSLGPSIRTSLRFDLCVEARGCAQAYPPLSANSLPLRLFTDVQIGLIRLLLMISGMFIIKLGARESFQQETAGFFQSTPQSRADPL